jgi:FMN phosphatase YigB (HAD superfamily)
MIGLVSVAGEPSRSDVSGVAGSWELRRHLAAASAVSFDFFDTLFVRPLLDPEDTFDLIGLKFGIPEFRTHRRQAQAEAFVRMRAAGRKEITLGDIYACFPKTHVAQKELMKAEYALELSLLEPNPEMFDLLKSLLAAGKKVAITSDMYLSADFFREALKPHGLDHVPLLVSADCNATKRDAGELFGVLAERLGAPVGDILHIGDNHLSDFQRPREIGMRAFHYKPGLVTKMNGAACLTASIGRGLLRTKGQGIRSRYYEELGFVYGGPANWGFLAWIKERARRDKVDHLLFVARDGYALERVARAQSNPGLPGFTYFLGSRTTFTLAAMRADNFSEFIPFLLSGSDGLAPCELLERIGVQPPSARVMADLGLGVDVRITPGLHERLAHFLVAYRWEILKVCKRNRRALYQYLRQLGVEPGSRVALVDVGWSGTTQEAFEMAVKPLMDLDVLGYYFCLANTPERKRRDGTQRMAAMVTAENTSNDVVAKIYDHRVAVELFFSAPHDSVIGLQSGQSGVEPILDAGRGDVEDLSSIAEEIVAGTEAFVRHYSDLMSRLGVSSSPLQTAWPLIEWVTGPGDGVSTLLGKVRNFDAWASSRNHKKGRVQTGHVSVRR